MKKIYMLSALLAGTLAFSACNDDNVTVKGPQQYPTAPSGATLKSAAAGLGLKMGNTLSSSDLNNPEVLNIIKQEFDNVSFGYHMKHGAIVQADGTYNFNTTDAMVQWCKDNGIGIYGHTLVWHQNQNAAYLKKVAAPPVTEFYGPNLIQKGDFEGDDDPYSYGWNSWGNSSSREHIKTGGDNAHTGNGSIKFTNPTENANAWGAQLEVKFLSDLVAGKKYRFVFWIRSEANGGGRCSSDPNASYQGDFTTNGDWKKITWDFEGKGGEKAMRFDMGKFATSYYIDDVTLNEVLDGPPSLINDGSFTSGLHADWNSWGNSSTREHSPTGGRSGGALKFTNPSAAANVWNAQIEVKFISELQAGKQYAFNFWIRSEDAGGGRCSTDPNASYQGDFNTNGDWQKITWVFEGKGGEKAMRFDMGKFATSYYIDDVTFTEYVPTSSGEGPSDEDKAKIQNAMQSWISEIVGRYKNEVDAWDVVNEPMADGNSGIRTSQNTELASDGFLWTDMLGRDYAVYAFEAAHAASPDAKLFINDYNLEYNPAKLDSLLSYVKEIQAKLDARGSGAKIHGIGTQMHIASVRSYTQVLAMFEKLAQTGLLVKVTELDVKVNELKAPTYTYNDTDAELQAAMYQYIVDKYLTVVPKAQQYGLTIWGVQDGSSWLNETARGIFYHPLLWNDNLQRKTAYNAVYQALTGN
jgi:Beta-1,4-xylanase